MKKLVTSVNIESMLSACRIVGGRSSSNGVNSVSEVRKLLIKMTLTYALLYKWLISDNSYNIYNDWQLLKQNVVNGRNDIFSKVIKKGLSKFTNITTTAIKDPTKLLDSYEACFKNIKSVLNSDGKSDILTWLELVIMFENGSGFISNEANEAIKSKYGTTCFTSDGRMNWLLAMTFSCYVKN